MQQEMSICMCNTFPRSRQFKRVLLAYELKQSFHVEISGTALSDKYQTFRN